MRKEVTTCNSSENSNDILEILNSALHDLEKYENDNFEDNEFFSFSEDNSNLDTNIKDEDEEYLLEDETNYDDDFDFQFMEDVYDEIDFFESKYFVSMQEEKKVLIH